MFNPVRQLEQLWQQHKKTALAARIRADKNTRKTFLNYLSERQCRIIVNNDDHRLMIDPMDSVIGERVLHVGHWHRDQFTDILTKLQSVGALRAGGTFVDVGANIGTQTIYAMRSGLFRNAVAVEPEPNNFELLKQNIALNDLTDSVKLYNVAAGLEKARLSLTVRKKNHGGHALGQPLEPGDRQIDVDVMPLSEILSAEDVTDIGLLWIDCEGHEPEVLAGGWSAIPAGTPICIEFTPERYGDDGTRAFVASLAARFDQFLLVNPDGAIHHRTIDQLSQIRDRVDVVLFGAQTDDRDQ